MRDVHVHVTVLDERGARQAAGPIASLLDQVPLVTWTEEDVIADHRPSEELIGKWELSRVATNDGAVVGVLLSHVRRAAPPWYPRPVCYLAGLAVSSHLQGLGIGRQLVEGWVQDAATSPLLVAHAVEELAVQTNAADWNERVQKLYERAGFAVTGSKTYSNRTDVVMRQRIVRY